jgi:hypothetical protein
MGGVWLTHGEMNVLPSLAINVDMLFVSLLALNEFRHYMLKCILCPGWYMRGLVNTCCDAFCVLKGMERLVQIELR